MGQRISITEKRNRILRAIDAGQHSTKELAAAAVATPTETIEILHGLERDLVVVKKSGISHYGRKITEWHRPAPQKSELVMQLRQPRTRKCLTCGG